MQVTTGACLAVTSANKNVAGTLKWLDELYGEEGIAFGNYGKEGLTYKMVDGEPVFTDYITANKDGKGLSDMVSLTCAVRDSGFPMIQTWQFYKQTLSDWGVEAIENWGDDNPNIDNILPTVSRTQEESEDYGRIMNPIKTYMLEQVNKVIMGTASMADWDNAVKQMEKMDIESAVKIQQAAYDRYVKR